MDLPSSSIVFLSGNFIGPSLLLSSTVHFIRVLWVWVSTLEWNHHPSSRTYVLPAWSWKIAYVFFSIRIKNRLQGVDKGPLSFYFISGLALSELRHTRSFLWRIFSFVRRLCRLCQHHILQLRLTLSCPRKRLKLCWLGVYVMRVSKGELRFIIFFLGVTFMYLHLFFVFVNSTLNCSRGCGRVVYRSPLMHFLLSEILTRAIKNDPPFDGICQPSGARVEHQQDALTPAIWYHSIIFCQSFLLFLRDFNEFFC